MSAPSFALLAGVVYIVIGLAANLSTSTLHPVLNILHLLVGVWGFMAWTGYVGAVGFARTTTVLMAALALLGLIPGNFPSLHGFQVWLHAATAAAAAYFGFRSLLHRPGRPTERRRSIHGERRHLPHPVTDERRRGLANRRFGAGNGLTAD